MLVTLSGIVTPITLGHQENAELPDISNSVGDCVATGFATRVFDEHGLGSVEQDPVHTAIERSSEHRP